jgi:3-oxoacyl-[acyl-carrier protein] reductase
MSLEGKVALVTGASRGIGKAIAESLQSQGAVVIGTATTEKGAESISSYLSDKGGAGLALNVTDNASIESVLGLINDKYGAPQILVNNAGITKDNLFLRLNEDEWQSVIDTNLTGVYRLTKACIRNMFKKRWGRIISIGSVVGASGNAGQANYAAAKAAIIGFTKSVAQEVAGRGVTANVVSPGFIDTDMTRDLPDSVKEELLKRIPMKRLGQAEDIANAVSFLASESANYITGETIHVNGGMYMG